MDQVIHDRHDDAEHAVRADPQSNAGDIGAGRVVAVARRGNDGPGSAEGVARISYAGEMVAWPVSARVGNVKNNDPSLIEPVTTAVRA
jgi:hypothetical protein